MTPSEISATAGPAATARAVATSVSIRMRRMMLLSFLDPQVLVQLVHRRVEMLVLDHVHDSTALHDVVAVGHGRGEAEVLFDEQDREPLGLETAQRRADLLDDDGRQSLRRLVEEEQTRARAQDTRDREHLLLAARALRPLAPEPLPEIREQIEDRVDTHAAGAHGRGQHEILLDVEACEDAALLGTERDPQPRDSV